MVKFEKPQKGNPHELTIRQHVLPRRSIERFVNVDGLVEVYITNVNKRVQLPSDDVIFCARRVWDERAEHGFMKSIEDEFQALADQIEDGSKITLSDQENIIASSFFCLWDIRAHFRENPIGDQKGKGIVDVEYHLSKDEEESLEKGGISFVKSDQTVPGRQLTGAVVQIKLHRCQKQFADLSWGILHSSHGEFVVSDRSRLLRMIPISPTVCLYASDTDQHIRPEEVSWLNRKAIEGSDAYFFARELRCCPGAIRR